MVTMPVSSGGNGQSQKAPTIKSFRDLEVYNSSYSLAVVIAKEMLQLLPDKERYNLIDQLSRSTQAIPRLIAEGYAKRHQKFGFQKYLDDAMAETNESIVGIEMCRDLYDIFPERIAKLVDAYDKVGRQIYRLAAAWSKFKDGRRDS